MNAYGQEVTVGPVTVDTGNDWFDLGAVAALLVLVCVLSIVHKRWTK